MTKLYNFRGRGIMGFAGLGGMGGMGGMRGGSLGSGLWSWVGFWRIWRRRMVSSYGAMEVRLKMDPVAGLGRGFCFVVYTNGEEARTCVKALKNY